LDPSARRHRWSKEGGGEKIPGGQLPSASCVFAVSKEPATAHYIENLKSDVVTDHKHTLRCKKFEMNFKGLTETSNQNPWENILSRKTWEEF